MKTLGFIIMISFITFPATAQFIKQSIEPGNFELQVNQTMQYYQTRSKGRGTGFKQFKRWEEFVKNRLDKDGNRLNNCAMSFIAYKNMKKRGEFDNSRSNGNWTELGPDDWTNNPDPYPGTSQGGWLPGNGRINEIAFHPTNANIIYAGAAGGGLWKTTDGGSTWASITDGMPNLSISGIAVSHTNSDVVYILTGDGDSWDLMSIGVLKTIDGGASWTQTGLNFGRDELIVGYELKMNPTSSNVLIATTSNGIYRTINDGDDWTLVEPGRFFDIEYSPSNPDTVYASTDDTIFRSANGGVNWNWVCNLSGFINADKASRIELAVTQDNTDKVYALLGDKIEYLGVFISENRGTNWTRHFDNMGPNILASDENGTGTSTQATYDLAIEVSPTDEDEIYVGGINIWKSINGGDDWTISTHWRQDWAAYEYVHADIHELIFNGFVLFTGCDGGVFKTSNGGTTWIDLSQGLSIMQPHKIGITNSNTDLVYMGTQDNGVNRYSGNTTVDHVRGADGFECIIMPTNSDTVFTSRQFGIVERSVDGGNTFSKIIDDIFNKQFNNPLLLKPGSNDRLVVSTASEIDIHYLSGTLKNTKHIPQDELHFTAHLDISQTDSDLLIASSIGRNDIGTKDSLWMTVDLFQWLDTWTNITGNLPVEECIISDIVIDPANDDHFIVSFGGYVDGDKVFETWNRGGNWTNVSYNLENVPVNCIAVDSEVANSVYIGTDLGVFYKEPGETTWTYYGNGLPPVMIHELEINTNDNIIYAATYGRGLWTSALYCDCPQVYTLTQANDPSNPNYTGVQHYEASSSINSTRQIVGGFGTDVYYQAGVYVDLEPGFVAKEGNLFETVIGQCGGAKKGNTKPKIEEIQEIED